MVRWDSLLIMSKNTEVFTNKSTLTKIQEGSVSKETDISSFLDIVMLQGVIILPMHSSLDLLLWALMLIPGMTINQEFSIIAKTIKMSLTMEFFWLGWQANIGLSRTHLGPNGVKMDLWDLPWEILAIFVTMEFWFWNDFVTFYIDWWNPSFNVIDWPKY